MPEGLFQAPKYILSRKHLRGIWEESRDASARPASPGIDGQTAQAFAQKLDANIDRLHSQLMEDRFRYLKLRPVPIPKDDGKIRIICVPAVRDRLVQRALVRWLVETKKMPQQDFVYGVKGRGAKLAINQALSLRGSFDWCLKTDIQAFFDKIHRGKLKQLIENKLRGSSALPLLLAAVDQEIKPRNQYQAREIAAAGIVSGKGIRQGMPLSPLLANFSLLKFDAICKGHKIKILRYADDILAFFNSEEGARAGLHHIREALKPLELLVPDMGSAKTDIIPPKLPVTFLGRELVYLDTAGKYVARVGRQKLDKIKANLANNYALKSAMEEGSFVHASDSLAASIRSYLGSYQDAYNFAHFESEIRGHYKAIIAGWLKEIFGAHVIQSISDKHRSFLGIKVIGNLEPSEDLELTS
jgi:retron-type reverse transcriptase